MKIKSVKYNFIMNFILTASNFLFPLITFPYVSRVLQVEGNGKIAFIGSVISYFTMIASLGIPTYGIRACATVRDNKEKLSKTVHELIFIHVIMTFLTVCLLIVATINIEKLSAESELVCINSLGLILNVIGVNWLYSALEQYDYIAFRSIIFKVISVFLMFIFIKKTDDYILYGAISVFASGGSNILNFIRIRRFIFMKKYDSYDLKKHLKPILIFFAQSAAISIYTNMDTVMLGFLKGDTEVGLYSTAVKIKNILVSLVTSLGTVMLPRLSYFINNNFEARFLVLIKKAVNFVLLMSVSLTIFFVIMAEESILILSGDAFRNATSTMQIIIPSIIFIGLASVTGTQILTPLNREKIVLISVCVGAISNIFLNWLFIPQMGADGAALGTIATEILVFIIQLYYVSRVCKIQIFIWKESLKIIISLIIPIITLVICKIYFDEIMLRFVLAVIFYFGSSLLLCLMLNVRFIVEIIYPFLRRIIKRDN